MRSFYFLLLSFLLFFGLSSTAQNTDSLRFSVDSTGKAIQEVARDFQRWKDSVQRERIFRNVERNGKSLDVLLQEKREQEKKEQRRMWIRIGAGVLLLVVLLLVFAQGRNKKT